MFRTISLRTVVALLVLIALGGTVAGAQPASPPAGHEAHHPATPTSMPQSGSGPMMGIPGAGMPGMGMGQAEFDLMFIDMMIIHHQGAVAMAEVALERGEHPELVAMAEDIIATQNDEIAQLQAWRDAWYPGAPVMSMEDMMGGMMGMMGMMPGMQDMMAMMGMMDPATMAGNLRNTSQPFDLAFINAMIPHHLGALMMTEMAAQQASHPELGTAAQAIFDTQVEEIATMRGWRAEWYGQAATPAS